MADALITLPASLDRAASERGDAGYTFVRDDGTERTYTFVELRDLAKSLAVGLAERGMKPGDRVALVLPAAEEFVPTFLGVLHGGGVPVPLYPPMGLGQLGGYLDHCRHIVSAARATLVITTSQIKAVIGTVREATPDLRAMLTFADLEGDATRFRAPKIALEDTAFIQFTSGSTSRPKGVVLTHANLAINCRAIMGQGLSSNTTTDRGVSWLPLFHDMGLIGFVIAPIMHLVPVTFMSPLQFLKRPASWLQVLSKHRGTITYAPNFAYALCMKRIKDEDLAGVDLSSVRVAGCGAEPIQAETLRAFAKRFGRFGFREEAFVPSYGMAESSLAIAFSQGVPTDCVDGSLLWSTGEARPVPEGTAGAIEVVGCGTAFEGHGLRAVDTTTREPLGDRRVGELEIRGPSVMQGYFEDAVRTREVLAEDGWFRTGDLGYLADGQVYICGRQKDVIIVNGRNYYPSDLEWAASRVEGVRPGNVVAFPTFRAGLDREAVVVVAETKSAADAAFNEALAVNVRTEINRSMGLMVDEVVIAAQGTVPKTSSGKIQRAKARALYEAGELKPREAEGRMDLAKHVLGSQLAHLRLGIFGSKRS